MQLFLPYNASKLENFEIAKLLLATSGDSHYVFKQVHAILLKTKIILFQ